MENVDKSNRPNFQEYRLNLVSILFGLVLTDASIAAFSCIKSVYSQEFTLLDILPGVSQIGTGIAITISSWFGWHNSIKNSKSNSEQYIKALSIIDLAMVFLYFGIIATRDEPGKPPSAIPEFVIVSLILLLYVLYDIISKSHPDERWKSPWPSLISLATCFAALLVMVRKMSSAGSSSVLEVVYADVYLALLIFWFFRAAKSYQRGERVPTWQRHEPSETASRTRVNCWNTAKREFACINDFRFACLMMAIGFLLLLL